MESLMVNLVSGRHCCLWCQIKHEDLIVPRSQREKQTPRSLQNIKNNYQCFMTEGHGDLKMAKFFNNVVDEHFIDIEEVHHNYCYNIGYNKILTI